jgi:integrase
MASIKFFTKGNRNPNTIYLRLTHGRKIDMSKSISLIIQNEYWNNKRGTVRQIAEFNNKLNFQNTLNDLKSNIIGNFNKNYAEGKTINGNWLEDLILSFFNQSKENDLSFLLEYAKYHIENLPNKVQKNGKVGLAKATITKFNSTLQKILDYEKYKNKSIRFFEVDFKFHKDFIYFLHNKQQLNYNSTGKYLANIKAICKAAKRDGLKIHSDVEHPDFRVPKQETSFIILNFQDIDRIFECNFKETMYLNNARDWLIIGVWTGARAGDLLNFSSKNIKDGFIEYQAQKTQQKVIVAIHPQVQEILSKGFPYQISLQKYNDYIKKVCRLAGINQMVEGSKSVDISKSKKSNVFRKVQGDYQKWELVSTHIGRRSFATNHYGKLPTQVLMAQTGHKTEKMFLKYIGQGERDNAQILKEYWEKNQKPAEDSKIISITRKTAMRK